MVFHKSKAARELMVDTYLQRCGFESYSHDVYDYIAIHAHISKQVTLRLYAQKDTNVSNTSQEIMTQNYFIQNCQMRGKLE